MASRYCGSLGLLLVSVASLVVAGCVTLRPVVRDTDGDGVPDAQDVCQGFDDNLDADGDGVPDGCDICLAGDDAVDADADGVPDACDVLVSVDGLGSVSEDGLLLTALPADGWEFSGWMVDGADAGSGAVLETSVGSVVIAGFRFSWPEGVPDLDVWLASNPQIATALVWETPLPPGAVQPRPCGKKGTLSCGAVPAWPWPADLRDSLYRAFVVAWREEPTGLSDPPENAKDTSDGDTFASQAYLPADAKALFLAFAANTLAVEIDSRVPWSILDYTGDELAILLDSRRFFRLASNLGSYVVGLAEQGMSTMTTPETALSFLRGEMEDSRQCNGGRFECDHVILMDDAPTGVAGQVVTVVRTIHWFRLNVIHFVNHWWNGNTEAHWQYRGFTPVVRLMTGTQRGEYLSETRNDTRPDARTISRTAGCWGTTGFMINVLRAANIPVILEQVGGHALPHFPTLARAGLPSHMSHGDDPYSRTVTSAMFPSSSLLMPENIWTEWFRPPGDGADAIEPTDGFIEDGFLDGLDPDVDFGEDVAFPEEPEREGEIENTPGRRVGGWIRELNIQWPSGYNMWKFCQDGRVAVDGGAAMSVQRNHAFEELLSPVCLTPEPPPCPDNWFDMLDDAVEAEGGCDAVGQGKDKRGEVSPN